VLLAKAGLDAPTPVDHNVAIASLLGVSGEVKRIVTTSELGDTSQGLTLCLYAYELYVTGDVTYRCGP
jgi:hypothetical protein